MARASSASKKSTTPTKAVKKKAAAKKAPAKKAPAKKAPAKKAPAKKTVSSKVAAKKTTQKKAPIKTTTPIKTETKKAVVKKAVVKKAVVKKAVVKKAVVKKAVVKKAVVKTTTPKSTAKKSAPAKSPFSATFLASQQASLTEERKMYERQFYSLRDEAESLVADFESGDVQFDEESGEGDTLNVERERDLALSAQAQRAVDAIDHALSKFELGTYGICEVSGDPIPKERLEAIPWVRERVEYKIGSLTSR